MFCDDARAPSSGIGGSRDVSSDDFAGASDDASAAGLELDPLVERVASALEQRCGVRGGDLVRLGAGNCTAAVVAHVLTFSISPPSCGSLFPRNMRVLCAHVLYLPTLLWLPISEEYAGLV